MRVCLMHDQGGVNHKQLRFASVMPSVKQKASLTCRAAFVPEDFWHIFN